MIEQRLEFELPPPWSAKKFETDRFGPVSFLVGPNGSGKSRFAEALRRSLSNARLLGTDRLEGMGLGPLQQMWGDNLRQGLQKQNFANFAQAGVQRGSGIDTFIILEERPDIRILVEGTLSHLFGRKITLEWDSGFLLPMVTVSKTGARYRADREECHGIRELLVLLTHLYDDRFDYLIVDEPELNLHPQFQSYFMQQVRIIAGHPKPKTRTKGIFLITHSPFIIDIRTMDDLRSIISFSSDHTPPRTLSNLSDDDGYRFQSLIPRLNVHHKQFFFSDNPIFVEGAFDSDILSAIQERRKMSVTGAGSCIIDVGGSEEINKYLELCRYLGKEANFFYDLDSLFYGNLRQCIRSDETISGFLADIGLGNDFSRYCGELDRRLTTAVSEIKNAAPASPGLNRVKEYIESLSTDTDGQFGPKELAKARVATLVYLHWNKLEAQAIIGNELFLDVSGRIRKIFDILQDKKIFILPGGALEHYLPSYTGDRYVLPDSQKKAAITSEIYLLASGQIDHTLSDRYGDLFYNICKLPGKPPVDIDPILFEYLGDYTHELQGIVIDHPEWSRDQINKHFLEKSSGLGKLFVVTEIARESQREFKAKIVIKDGSNRTCNVTHETNAGMRRFELQDGLATPAPAT